MIGYMGHDGVDGENFEVDFFSEPALSPNFQTLHDYFHCAGIAYASFWGRNIISR